MSKLCITCKHFDFEAIGWVEYGTYTGGDLEGGMSCKKGHFYESRPSDGAELRDLFSKAIKCKDYDDEPLTSEGR